MQTLVKKKRKGKGYKTLKIKLEEKVARKVSFCEIKVDFKLLEHMWKCR